MKKLFLLLIACMLMLSTLPALADEVPTISIHVQMPSEFVPENNPFVEQIEKAVGVKIKWIMPPMNSYNESLNLMIADGNYPDIIQMPGITSPAYMCAVESDVLLPLDDLIGQFENLSRYIDPISYDALRASSGGTLYGIARNTIVRQDGFLVRKDWLKKLNIAFPEDGLLTLDEFYNMLHAFTYGDPDGNGVQDTYGMVDNSTNGILYPFITYAFGCRGYQAHEGKYAYMDEVYCMEHDNYKNALSYTAKLWQDGLIDPVWPSTIGNAYRDRFYTGAVGMARFFGGWIADFEENLLANFPDAEVAYLVGIKDEKGVCQAGSTFGGNVNSFYSLSVSTQGKEEKALAVLDYLLSDDGWNLMNYGVKGLHWDENENGEKYATEKYAQYNKYRSYVTLLRRYTDPSYFVSINCTPAQKEFATEAIARAIEITVPSLSLGYTPASAQETALLEYNSELDVVRSKIIVGELPVQAWDDALEKWYSLGGEQVIEDMVAFIQSHQK